MFSLEEKKYIAAVLEKTILELNHPEMPKEKPVFTLHIQGSEDWSWADIRPNWTFEKEEPKTTEWNEHSREIMNNKNI
jgi:hypothetical protein